MAAGPGRLSLTPAASTELDTEEPSSPRSMYKYPDRRPAEVVARSGNVDEYLSWRASTALRDPYRVPMDVLRGTKPFQGPTLAEAPLICFINTRSGGLAGPHVAEVLSRSISVAQVFDVSQFRPGDVLRTIYGNLHRAIADKDKVAKYIARNLNILCCGGDGTVAWVLKTVQDLQLQPPPHIAICPLGTGNDLALTFGWGNAFQKKWFKGHKRIYKTLARVVAAKRIDLDCWSATLTVPRPDLFSKLPHSMEAAASETGGQATVRSLFWNYLSFGIDAESAWGFAHLREAKPKLANRRALNMGWYAWFSCTSGWFCPGHYALQDKLRVKLMARQRSGEMAEVHVSHGIGAIVLLNLQSYGGGRDLWGLADTSPDYHTKKTFKAPIFNDGMFEVVGLRNGWHTALVMGKFSHKLHATRLAQTDELLLEATAPGAADATTFMQVDGEPWPQQVPAGEEPLQLHVRLHGKSNMLFNTAHPLGSPTIRKLVQRSELLSNVEDKPQIPERSFASAILKERRLNHKRLVAAGTVPCSPKAYNRNLSSLRGQLHQGLDALVEETEDAGDSASSIVPPWPSTPDSVAASAISGIPSPRQPTLPPAVREAEEGAADVNAGAETMPAAQSA